MTELIEKNEKKLFYILAVLSFIVWVGLTIVSFGTIFIFIAIGYLLTIFVQSGFISYLKGSGALITEEQFPDLYKAHVECCQKLSMNKQPTLILIHGNGMFNAFATRFLRQHYVILLSDIVDAMGDDIEALKFYIGHELGHIKRKHILWIPVLAPVSFLPILGAAYSRSREITCDNHGRYCCDSKESAIKAMSALIVGAQRWKTLNVEALLKQTKDMGGFWMSFHELASDYPWTVRRIAYLQGEEAVKKIPRRNIFAWVLALITPRLNFVSIMIIYLMVFVAIQGKSILSEIEGKHALQGSEGYSGVDEVYVDDSIRQPVEQLPENVTKDDSNSNAP